MKMYSTAQPSGLLVDARARLLRDGYLPVEVPDFWLGDYKQIDRPLRLTTSATASTYWRADFSLFTNERHTVGSSHRAAHKALAELDVKAATFNQWGLFLGALLDEAERHNTTVRLSGPYDPLNARAPRSQSGLPFDTSAALFRYVTTGQFTAERRAAQAPVLSCHQHTWLRDPDSGMSVCSKCGHTHRFGG